LILTLLAPFLHSPKLPVTPPVQVLNKPTATYRIPYSVTATKHLMVRAKINGQGPFNFIVDTGAPALYVATAVAEKAGIKPAKDQWGVVDRLEIEGGAVLPNIRVRLEDPHQVTGMNQMGLIDGRLDGILGYDVLARFRIELDLTASSMKWTKLDYEPPPPLSLAQLAGKKPLQNTQNLANMEKMSKMASAMFARKALEPVTRGFVGIEVEASGGAIRVKRVLPAGPAAGAGILQGDTLTHVKLPELDAAQVKTESDLMQAAARLAAGETVRLTIVRGGTTKQVSIVASRGGL
jgi:hypothetical protein